jgi:hypothetical protein
MPHNIPEEQRLQYICTLTVQFDYYILQNNSWAGRNCLSPGCSLFDRTNSDEQTCVIFYCFEGLQLTDIESYKGHNYAD